MGGGGVSTQPKKEAGSNPISTRSIACIVATPSGRDSLDGMSGGDIGSQPQD